ncbi:Dynein light chain [Trichostrongylus colubriformis]|uniref:Dynein light chain n=1 Tax=Trichostrongylus colubriformis TaxID=6319 RepID=A0AAN8FT15_TRICO
MDRRNGCCKKRILPPPPRRDVIIKSTDMSVEMQREVVSVVCRACEKYCLEKDIATFIKHELDRKYGHPWHCVVGRNYGSFVTHETYHFMYLYVRKTAVMIFKSGC